MAAPDSLPASRPMTPAELAATLGGAVLAHDYGRPDAASALMAAGRRVAWLGPGAWAVDGAAADAAELARLAAELAPAPPPGVARDPGAISGPCPDCGQPTACGWREPTARGRWREVTVPPTPCLDCRAAAIRAALAGPPPADVPAAEPPPVAPGTPESAPGCSAGGPFMPVRRAKRTTSGTPGAGEAGPPPPGVAWPVCGRSVAICAGMLTVDGRPVAEGVTPADVTVYGARLFVAGRPVADLAADRRGAPDGRP